MANPKGDPAVMKKYLDAAKEEGVTPTDGGELLTIATNADPGNQTAQVAQAQLNKMGFKLNYRKVPQDTLYTKFCGVPKSNYVICPNVGWFKDFTDPAVAARADVQGRRDQAPGQRELEPAGQQGDQRRDDRGVARTRR